MKHKIFTFLLAVMASASMSFAETYSGSCGENLTWSLNTEDGVLTISGTGAMEEYESYTATLWYSNRESIKSIVIKEGVTSIGKHAFCSLNNLTSVTIPNSVTVIGNYAFGSNVINGCSNLTAVHISDLAAWCNIKFSASTSNPLYYAKNLYLNGTLVEELVIPDGITKINDYAFYNCSSLTSVTIPNSVTSIGKSAFSGCKGLTSVNIPNSVTTIESSAFVGCSSLNAVNIFDLAAWCNISFSAASSNPLNYAKNLYLNGILVEKIVIPNGVTKINDYTFYNCSSLTSVTIPNGVTSIGNSAFYGCSSMTAVTIPSSVTTIGSSAFGGCSSLTAVNIYDLAAWCNISFKASFSNPLYYAKNLYLNGTLVKDLVIPNGVTKINDYAFYNCSSLTSVTIPNSVTSIGNCAFYGCSGLTSITIPNGVTSIGSSAFYKCSGLTSVTIPSSITTIEINAFNGCSSLTAVNISDLAAWCNISFKASSSNPLYYAKNLYLNGTLVEELVIPNGVSKINNCTFYNCSSLTSVAIPNSVTTIGSNAFSGCSGLTSVTIPNSVDSIGTNAFRECTGITSLTISNSVTTIESAAFWGCTGLTSITNLATTPQAVSTYVFGNPSSNTAVDYSVCTLYVPAESVEAYKAADVWKEFTNILSIGESSDSCVIASGTCGAEGDNLTWTLSCDSVLTISGTGEMADYEWNKAPWFSNAANIVSVEISEGITSIGDYAFNHCSKISSVSIPSGVTSIGFGAFSQCFGLTSVNMPNTLTTIGESAFVGDKSLTIITIPSSVTNIGNWAFENASKITSIICEAVNPPVLAAAAYSEPAVFLGIDKSIPLYVPAESIELYRTAAGWKEFTNILPIGGYPEVNDTLTIAEAIQIGMALDSMATSVDTYTIEGYVINAGAFYKGSKDQSWYMADDAEATSSDFQAYRCYPIDGTDTVEVQNGSKVRMTGKLQKYYNRSTGKYIVEMTYTPAIILSTPVQAPLDTITVAEALAIGATLADNAATAKQYVIRGYVSSVSPYVEQYGYQNFYIADEPNSTANSNAAGGFYVYRGVPSTGTAVTVGNLVELTCAIRKYVSASGTITYIENSEYPIPVTVLQVDTMPCVIASGTCGENLTWTLNTCDSVLTISGTGKMADYSSSLDQSWYAYSEAIKSVIIGNGVTSIGRLAFYGFISLTSIEIPNGVTSIGEYAFGYCSMGSSCSMYSVTIPNSVTSIGNYAFFGCHSLTSVTIPNSVTSIGNYAFAFCSGLTAINVDTDNPKYTSIDGVLFNNNKKLLKQYPGGRQGTYTIPSSVTNIGTAAFAYSKGLTSIEIPNSVTSIGEYAFWEVRGLTSVTIPNSVINIGEYAFANFRSLTSVTNYATAPQAIDTTTFDNVDKSACTLYVPAESLESYKTANGWKEFTNILPIGGTTPPQESDREGQSTEGKDFWVTFMLADQDSNNDLVLSLSISSRENCQVAITNPYTGYMETVNVTANQMQLVELYSGNVLLANARTEMANSGKVCYAGYSEQVDTCALRVTATSDISLFATNYKRATFDATNVLPTALLGDEYFIQTYSPSDHGGVDRSQGSHFAIIATEDNTIVDYCPTVMTQAVTDSVNVAQAKRDFMGEDALTEREKLWLHYTIGDTLHTPVLMAGQVYYVWTGKKDGDTGDLSGTYVKARDGKRIAVFQGNPHTNVPYMIKQRDQLYSQAMPVRYWGSSFALTSSATRPSDIIRVMAVHDGTEVYINGEPVHTFDFTVDTKHYWEFEIGPSGTYGQNGSCMLATSHPVGVHLFLTSQQYKGDKNSNGDPAMMWVSPIEHQMEQVNIATYSGINGATSYVNIVTDKPEVMTLDGASITSNFSPVSGSNTYYYAQITLGTTAASHTLKSNGGKFNAHVYGFSSNESYAYSAGSFIEDHTISVIINGNEFTSESGMMELCVRDTFLLDIITTNCQVSRVDYGDGTVENFHFTDGVSVDSLYTKHAYSKPGLYQATVSVTYTLNTTDTFLTVFPLRIYAGPIDLEYEPLGDIYVGDSIFYIYYHTPLQDMKIDEDFVMNRFFNSAALEDGFGKMSTRLNKSFFGIRIPETARAGVEYAFGVNVETPCETFTVEIPFVLKNRRTGTCGDNNALTWTYDPETKTLTISGNGTLNSNYTFGPEAPTEMEQLIIAEGVTSIGDSAFRNMSTLQTMQLPASLKTIGAKAFENCINLTSIYNYRERPCLVDATAFDGVNKFDCTLYVLEGSVEMYKSAASDWKDFYFILPISTTTVTEPVSDVTVEPHDNSATVTWPAQDNAVTYTIEISKDGVVFCRLTFNAYGQLTGIAFAPGRGGAHNAPAAIMTANGLQFTVTGLNSNTQYGYNITTRDSNDAAIATYSGKFTTTGGGDVTTGVDNVQGNDVQCTKVIRNGQIYILRGEKVYTVTGEEVR